MTAENVSFRVRIVRDEDPMSPEEWDSACALIVKANRYFAPKLPKYWSVERADRAFDPNPDAGDYEDFARQIEEDQRNYLASIAQVTEYDNLIEALCSQSVHDRAWAYETIGGYHGLENFDSYPLTLTEGELNERWSKQ